MLHQSKQQATFAHSSNEAEYISTSEADNEALWIAQFSGVLEYRLLNQLVSSKTNNQEDILFIKNLEFYLQMKNIEVKHRWIRKKVESKEIAIT